MRQREPVGDAAIANGRGGQPLDQLADIIIHPARMRAGRGPVKSRGWPAHLDTRLGFIDWSAMDSGFRLEHFRLLRDLGGQRWLKTPKQQAGYQSLKEAYRATERWAEELKRRRFPSGRTNTVKAPLNRGTWFWRYNWSRIWPNPQAPEQLCYTVGIDGDGTFNVKIDTAGPKEPWRSRYLAMLDDDYGRTPFVALLPAEQGVAMSLEQLVDWSIDSIARFEVGYAEVARRMRLTAQAMRRLDDQAELRRWFEVWRSAMLEAAITQGRLRWLPDCRLVLRPGSASAATLKCDVGDDPAGKRWAVQLNEPQVSSDFNPSSAIAVDDDGRHYLLHQGQLRTRSGALIREPEFGSKSGLRPVAVDDTGLAAGRTWYRVASLDASPARIREATAAFVEACARVRGWDEALSIPGDDFDNSEESGESYFTGPRGPIEGQEIKRRQGMVWLRLKQLLAPEGIAVCKTRKHRQGFQVDALIGANASMRLLVEIKTGISAGDIHGGVGQLHLYPKLLPTAAGLKPILLLPRAPHEDVLRAVRDLGITPHFFDFGDGSASGISFSKAFLAECRACLHASL